MITRDSFENVCNCDELSCSYFNDIQQLRRTFVIIASVTDTSTANSEFFDIVRDDFCDSNGRFNTVCSTDTTSFYDNTNDWYNNDTQTFYCTGDLPFSICCCQSGQNITTCDFVSGNLTFMKLRAYGGQNAGSGTVCSVLIGAYDCGTCDWVIESFETFTLCVNWAINTTCHSDGPLEGSGCVLMNTCGVCISCCHCANAGGANCSGNACIEWCKVSGNTYNIFCDGTCVSQSTSGQFALSICASQTTENSDICKGTGCALIDIAAFGRTLCGETCIKTVCIENGFCPSNIAVVGEKYGAGTVVFDVIDSATSNVMASNVPFNGGVEIEACADCLEIEIKQCSDGESCIKRWGYHLLT